MRFLCFFLLAMVPSMIEAATQKKESINRSSRERVALNGPKLSIKSIPSSTRQSDLYEIYLAPYRYVSIRLIIGYTVVLIDAKLFLNIVLCFFFFVPTKIQIEKEIRAVVSLMTPDINGVIFLTQGGPPSGHVVLEGFVNGLKPGKHGIHINQLGDIRDSCLMSGPHYNPYNVS